MNSICEYFRLYPATLWLGLVMLFLTIAYLLFLISASRRIRQQRVFYGFLSILLLAWLVHIFVLSQIEPQHEKSWFSIISISLLSSFELFLGDSHIFDNGFQDYLFEPSHSVWLLALSTLYLLAVCTSCYLIVSLFFKRLSSRIWLLLHRPTKNNFIFFGLNNNTRLLAKDILNTVPENKQIIIIDAPSTDDANYDASIFERLYTISSEKRSSVSRHQLKQVTLLKARQGVLTLPDKGYFRAIGLNGLSRWFNKNNKTQVFILSDNEDNNINLMGVLLAEGIRCDAIYCHASSYGSSIESLEKYYRREYQCFVKFIDSAYLSIQSLLKDKQYYLFQPIHFVDIAKENGRNLGYVSSSFTSLIVGFGECGQNAAAYLYEYGAFVNEDFSRAPFICHVFDPKIDMLSEHYSLRHPSMEMNRHFCFHNIKAGSSLFWSSFRRIAPIINYIIICTDNDEQNLSFAEDMLSMHVTSKRIAILVRQSRPSTALLCRSKRLKERYGNSFTTFGESERLWTYANVTNALLEREARAFYDQYSLCAGNDSDWNQRQERIRLGDPKSIRQQTQDYANVLHRHTKLTLLGDKSSVWESLERGITSGNDYTSVKEHFIGDKTRQDGYLNNLGRYLAAGEHLRWVASHSTMGFVYGDTTDDFHNKHSAMLPFNDLSEKMQHYDWLVVKTTLLLTINEALRSNHKMESYNNRSFFPSPIDVNDIILPEPLIGLSEQLAQNVHNVWAHKRFQEGWRYGSQRNDSAKLHPDLLPYELLPDQEKEYDRATSVDTIKLILKLGFEISKK